jgi:glycosyltransferase involved in cell wall biosynthesis
MRGATRLIYISNARLPSEKANTNQSMQQCEAFSALTPVEFWYPRRRNPLAGNDPFAYYAVSQSFSLVEIPSIDSPALWKVHRTLWFLVQAISFSARGALRLLRLPSTAVVYTRHEYDLWFVPLLKWLRRSLGIFFEDHDGFLRRDPALRRRLLQRVDGIIVTSSAHAQLMERWGISPQALLIAPNAAKLSRFQLAAPERRGDGQRTVVYLGNLYRWKGVYVLADAARFLPDEYTIYFVGGSPETLAPFRTYVDASGIEDRLVIVGHVPPAAVAEQLSRADVVVLPNSRVDRIGNEFTSPLKLFEYMASGRPIVASDVPAVREILTHGRNAYLVDPDDPAALAEGIRRVCEDGTLGRRLAEHARVDVAEHTWDMRSEKIMGFIRQRLDARGTLQHAL